MAEMVAAAWWAEQFQASRVQSLSLPLPGRPTQALPQALGLHGAGMGPSGAHLVGNLMQEDGHGG